MLAAETFAEKQRTKGSPVLFARRPVEFAGIRIPNWLGRVTLREVQGELHVQQF
jgi:hypothetical protein